MMTSSGRLLMLVSIMSKHARSAPSRRYAVSWNQHEVDAAEDITVGGGWTTAGNMYWRSNAEEDCL